MQSTTKTIPSITVHFFCFPSLVLPLFFSKKLFEEDEPVIVDGHVYFIDRKYYKPFDGIEWDLAAWKDKQTGEIVFAAKAGFFPMAYIKPTMINKDYISIDLALITETIKREKELDMMAEDDFEKEE